MSEDKQTTNFYHTKDDIKYFRFKVKLWKTTSSLDTDKKDNELEEFTFSWDEKVFSPLERHLYVKPENCTTPLLQKYHQDISHINSRGGKFPTKRMFSYVDQDKFNGHTERLTKCGSTSLSFAGKEMLAFQQITSDINRKPTHSNQLPLPKTNVVIDKPEKDFQREQHLAVPPLKSMFIMADLGPLDYDSTTASVPVDEAQKDPTTAAVVAGKSKTPPEEIDLKRHEVVLCILHQYSPNVISIRPEFSAAMEKPYRVVSSYGKVTYEFTFENMSADISKTEREREEKAVKEVQSRHKEHTEAIVGGDFELPPERSYRLLLMGEIVKATNFDIDSIYIHYFLDLPSGWSSVSMDAITGTTQLSSGKEYKRKIMFNFCFPLEFELIFEKSLIDNQSHDESPKWPVLYFEVCSLDSWRRYCVEGYSYMHIPSTPGEHHIQCHCWRPCGNSIVTGLRRFFVGGTPELEDSTFAAIPCDFEGSYLAKYGFRSETSGSLHIRLHCFHQSRDFIDKKLGQKSSQSLMERIGATKSFASVMNAVRAFRIARANLIQVREAFEGTLQKTVTRHQEDDDARSEYSQ